MYSHGSERYVKCEILYVCVLSGGVRVHAVFHSSLHEHIIVES